MDLQLQNQVAIVTGASRGLGYATALLLSQEGAKVAINSRNIESINKSAKNIYKQTGNEVFSFPADLRESESAKKLIDGTMKRWGKLDIIITNTGGPPAGSFIDFDDTAWYAAFELNFLSHLRLIRAGLPFLEKSQHPSVLTITSISVKQPITNLVLSNTIRAATIALTKSLSLELGKKNIRFNSILPGWTETERVNELMMYRASSNKTTLEQEMRKQSAESPLGRIGKPEEFANAAVFLVSPVASYITGVMLNVDGGLYKGLF